MNVRLLRTIQRRISAAPGQFIMHKWFERSSEIPNCQTAACIAGWAIAAGKHWTPHKTIESLRKDLGLGAEKWVAPIASELLGLNSAQIERLFHMGSWPSRFIFTSLDGHNYCALLACLRIDHFIATDGRE